MFWNRGRETIYRTDVVESSPFRIVATGDLRILDVKLVAANDSTAMLSVGPPDNPTIGFDFLARDAGAVFQVVHTGRSGSAVSLVGRLKVDSPLRAVRISRYAYTLPENVRSIHSRNVRDFLGLFVLLVVIIGSLIGFSRLLDAIDLGSLETLLLLGFALVISFAISMLWPWWIGAYSIKPPPGLNALSDNGESTSEYWDAWEPQSSPFPLTYLARSSSRTE